MSDEQSSRALHLADEIDRKLAQANGICNVVSNDKAIERDIANSMWAASDLIAEAKKAADQLWQIYRDHEHTQKAKAAQS